LADAVGARCCVDIAGSYSRKYWFGPHPDNVSERFFDAAVENARKIIDAVKPKTSRFTYEMMPHMIPDSADRYAALIEAIDRPAFGVHLDAVNIINSPYRFYDVSASIQECFDKLGPHVVSCHLKDIHMEDDITVRLGEVLAGTGGFDIALYLKGIAALPHHPPAMLEHLKSPEDYDQARAHVLSLGQTAGISFEE
jgi:L-ribulose-5-phosphate 3-epimerase UlaE